MDLQASPRRPPPKIPHARHLHLRAATKLTLLPSEEGFRFTILDPAPLTHYQGTSTSNSPITPSPIGRTWHPHPPPPEADFPTPAAPDSGHRGLIPSAYARPSRAATEFLTGNFGAWDVEWFRPLESTRVSLQDATGKCEVLFEDDVRAYEFVAAGNTYTAELSVADRAVHDIILVGDRMGFEGEAERSARRAGESWKRNR